MKQLRGKLQSFVTSLHWKVFVINKTSCAKAIKGSGVNMITVLGYGNGQTRSPSSWSKSISSSTSLSIFMALLSFSGSLYFSFSLCLSDSLCLLLTLALSLENPGVTDVRDTKSCPKDKWASLESSHYPSYNLSIRKDMIIVVNWNGMSLWKT